MIKLAWGDPLEMLPSHAWLVSRTGFQTQLKCKAVRIDAEMMSRVTIGERLSKRAVVKEKGIRWVCFQQGRGTPKETYLEQWLRLLSKTQTVTMGCVSWGMWIKSWLNVPRSEVMKSEQDKSAESLRKCSRGGQRLMIIKLRKYSKVRELLI